LYTSFLSGVESGAMKAFTRGSPCRWSGDNEALMIFFYSLSSFLCPILRIHDALAKIESYHVKLFLCKILSSLFYLLYFTLGTFFKLIFLVSSFNIELVRNWTSKCFLIGWSRFHNPGHKFKMLTRVDNNYCFRYVLPYFFSI